MKAILKKLDYNGYYEHVAYIINKLNNLPTENVPLTDQQKMNQLFGGGSGSGGNILKPPSQPIVMKPIVST